MKNDIIYDKFKTFIETYKEYFISNEEKWNNKLDKLKVYIDKHKKPPSQESKDNETKSLSRWFTSQKRNYKLIKEIMKNPLIYNNFKIFLETYKEYLLSSEEIWNNNLEKIIKYIDENKKLPSELNKNKEIKNLSQWFSAQNRNYKIKKYNMKNEVIYNKFKNFLAIYKLDS
jgi:hypothetical protein